MKINQRLPNLFLLQILFLIAAFLLITAHSVFGSEPEPVRSGQESPSAQTSKRMDSIIRLHSEKIQKWVTAPEIVNSVKQQNELNMPLAEIKEIDQKWISGINNDFALSLQENTAGCFLKDKLLANRIASDLYVESFLCDQNGAVVGEYPKTTDYWQGDEDKFIKSYNDGAGRLFIGPLIFDDSTRTYSVQISIPVKDGERTIGVLIVGLRNIK
ncbi:MAG: hypothetical protein A2277_13215 [Desulfobacterales bacterium RIFOXYA12_FULL_46_15]|nr:MAG: hypothetical protein A2277_13215 [Desulfobacterales bacterium RIFOXYA12_FULL_46_15]